MPCPFTLSTTSVKNLFLSKRGAKKGTPWDLARRRGTKSLCSVLCLYTLSRGCGLGTLLLFFTSRASHVRGAFLAPLDIFTPSWRILVRSGPPQFLWIPGKNRVLRGRLWGAALSHSYSLCVCEPRSSGGAFTAWCLWELGHQVPDRREGVSGPSGETSRDLVHGRVLQGSRKRAARSINC